VKCKKCKHFYKTMAGPNGGGYNPYPFCHYYENTGRRPAILTQECFEPRGRQRGKRTTPDQLPERTN